MVRIDSTLIEATAKIAVENRLTSYDAAYVAVAQRHDWQLVSTDIRDLVSKGLAVTPDAAV
jgi:predicted nucleic acid-binding protein